MLSESPHLGLIEGYQVKESPLLLLEHSFAVSVPEMPDVNLRITYLRDFPFPMTMVLSNPEENLAECDYYLILRDSATIPHIKRGVNPDGLKYEKWDFSTEGLTHYRLEIIEKLYGVIASTQEFVVIMGILAVNEAQNKTNSQV
ncbi:hypothetical protein KKG52_00420 [Patescibacteria group bacterium]|nr:hypothetical protein [Patescibacteria group bacterium]